MKIIIFVTVYIVELACVMFPRAASKIPPERRDQVLSLAQACSGGIFIGVIAHDMVPGALTDWAEVFTDEILATQLAMTCIVLGFVLIFFIEKVALVDKLHPKHDACEEQVVVENPADGYCTDLDQWEVVSALAVTDDEADDGLMLGSGRGAGPNRIVNMADGDEAHSSYGSTKHHSGHAHGHSHSHGHSHGHSQSDDEAMSSFSAREIVEKTMSAGFALVDKHRDNELEREEKLQLAIHAVEETFSVKFARMAEENPLMYLTLTLVLSIHTFIAGVAMGVTTDMTSLVSLFIGIMSHIWAVALALGVSLERAKVNFRVHMSIACIWSSALPAGLVCGTLLLLFLSEKATLILQGFFISLASGTFIYVAIIDILLSEFTKTKDKYAKMTLLVIGYVGITTLLFVFE